MVSVIVPQVPALRAFGFGAAAAVGGTIRAMKPRELLLDTIAFIPPAQALDGLTPEEAERHLAGVTHSIAEIVAHIAFWQNWFCRRLDGIHEPMVSSAALGWPEPAPGSWEDLKAHFLVGLERVAAHGSSESQLDRPVTPTIEFPPLMHYTTRDALVHVAHHNAYHLGQIVSLRQAMGKWPPASGGWTW
jgi:uncharacterized damage-inducible protein DinB